MFTISLKAISIHAPIGLYTQEHLIGNHFEVDIDVTSTVDNHQKEYFVDYTILNKLAINGFATEAQTLEAIAQAIHTTVREAFPFVQKIRVAIRKMKPPMPGKMAYAQVVYEQ